jgi:hypothetical protein
MNDKELEGVATVRGAMAVRTSANRHRPDLGLAKQPHNLIFGFLANRQRNACEVIDLYSQRVRR